MSTTAAIGDGDDEERAPWFIGVGAGGGGGTASMPTRTTLHGVIPFPTARQICCGSPLCDHLDVPLRYVLFCWAKHRVLRWANAGVVRVARWRYLS